MSKISDKELDELFLKASENTDVPFDPKDWEALSARLDDDLTPLSFRTYFLNGVALIIALSSILNLVDSSYNHSVAGENVSEVDQSSLSSDSLGLLKLKNDKTLSQQQDVRNTTVNDSDSISRKQLTEQLKLQKPNERINQFNKIGSKNNVGQRSSHTKAEGNNENKFVNLSAIKSSNYSRAGVGDEPYSNSTSLSNGGNRTNITGNFNENVNTTPLYGLDLSDLTFREISSLNKNNRSMRDKLFIKLTLSPDFSSIDYGKPGKPGVNAGLMVEYFIINNLSASSGAIWSRKIYSTKNPETTYSLGGYYSKVDLLDGDCRVLDIPLNLTYYFTSQRRVQFFVTAGVSSYVMLQEKYGYTVSVNNYSRHYEESYRNENNEWFSMLNLSIGVQRKISNRISLQAEPFLKAPIAGVGEGKVNLMSTGIFGSIKYKLK